MSDHIIPPDKDYDAAIAKGMAALERHKGTFAECTAQWERDCLLWRGFVLSGQYGHYCGDYDGLPIDESTPGWPCHCDHSHLEPQSRGREPEKP